MRLCRFDNDRLGVVDGDVVRDVTAALDVIPAYRYPLPEHDLLVANLGSDRRPREGTAVDRARASAGEGEASLSSREPR